MTGTAGDVHDTFRGMKVLFRPSGGLLVMTDPCRSDPRRVVRPLKDLGCEKACGKVEVMVPASHSSVWAGEGFVREARIGGLYGGGEDCLVMAWYPDDTRSRPVDGDLNNHILDQASSAANKSGAGQGIPGAGPEPAFGPESSATEICSLAKEAGGPFCGPWADNDAGVRMLAEAGTRVWGLRGEGGLRAFAAVEIHEAWKSASLTGWATDDPSLADGFLARVEDACRSAGVRTVHARVPAARPPMNLLLGRHHYRYGGTLLGHAVTDRGLEDVHLWYRTLPEA